MSKITDYSFLKMWLVSMKNETIWEGQIRKTGGGCEVLSFFVSA